MALNIDVGKIKFTWKGTYDAATTYEKDDVVYHAGDSWVCVIGPDAYGNAQTVTGTTPSSSATAEWNKMAQGSDLGNISGLTTGDTFYYNGTDFTRLGIGAAGQVLKVNTAANAPEWADSNAEYELARMTTETYSGGVWNMSTSYAWAPGAYIDYTPQHATTSSDKIEVHYNISKGAVNGYGMAHGRYYENGTSGTLTELARRSWQASDYHDTSIAFTWLHNGWSGANRVGWKFREYNSSHQAKLHSTYHYDGSSHNAFFPPLIIIKEWKAL